MATDETKVDKGKAKAIDHFDMQKISQETREIEMGGQEDSTPDRSHARRPLFSEMIKEAHGRGSTVRVIDIGDRISRSRVHKADLQLSVVHVLCHLAPFTSRPFETIGGARARLPVMLAGLVNIMCDVFTLDWAKLSHCEWIADLHFSLILTSVVSLRPRVPELDANSC